MSSYWDNHKAEMVAAFAEMNIVLVGSVPQEKYIFGLECDKIKLDEVRAILNKPEIGVYGPQNRSRGKSKVRRW